jgi:hypothetical protein
MRIVDGPKVGRWIEAEMDAGLGPLVRQHVPALYAEYVRVLHPALDADGRLLRWGEVAQKLDIAPRRNMQWHDLLGATAASGDLPSWVGLAPTPGELDDFSLNLLSDVLAAHTDNSDETFFGLSTIRSGVTRAFPTAPLLRLPQRDFVVLSGALEGVAAATFPGGTGTRVHFARAGSHIDPSQPPAPFSALSPNLIWPSDRSWFVSTEYEFASTLVGGSSALIDKILQERGLETWRVRPDDTIS